MKTKTYEDGFRNGVRCAASIAEDFDAYSSHNYLVSDVVLCKLNQTRRKSPRPNPKAEHFWIYGFALALAEMQRGGADSFITARVLREAGLTVAKLRAANVEAYDLEPIAAAVRGAAVRRK